MLTQRRKTRHQLREAALTLRAVPVLRKRLELHNAMVEEVQLSKKTERRKKSNLNPLTVVTGSIVKKYRLTNRLRSELGVSRQCAVPMQMKHLAVVKKSRLLESRNRLRQHITNFLELDENSTCLPGKRDAQKVEDEKDQKRVLNYYMHNLNMKYLAQNPDKKVSRSVFCTCRKANFVCASFGVRQTCLCLRHQNMSLKLQALKLLGVATLTNADAYIKEKKKRVDH